MTSILDHYMQSTMEDAMNDGFENALAEYVTGTMNLMSDAVGTEEGQECGRWSEPDEDCPKSHRCTGGMVDDSGCIICNICGEGYGNG